MKTIGFDEAMAILGIDSDELLLLLDKDKIPFRMMYGKVCIFREIDVIRYKKRQEFIRKWFGFLLKN